MACMQSRTKFVSLLTAVVLAGCSTHLPDAAAKDPSASSAAAPVSATRQEAVRDPSLDNRIVATFNVPAKWHFQSVLMQGGPCVAVPFIVFRATSPDGLSFVEQIPTYGWTWGTGPAASVKHDGCLPLKQAISAQEFLKYISATLNVEYLGDEEVPSEVNAKAQKDVTDSRATYAPKYAAMHIQQPDQTRELARATVRYKNGSFTMRGRLQATLDCTQTHVAGMKSVLRGMADQPGWMTNNCLASIRYMAAPQNQFPAISHLIDAAGMDAKPNQEWIQAWIDRNNRQTQQMVNQIRENGEAQRRATAQQFAHDQAVRQEMHEQFMATMQHGTDMSMRRAAEVANSNHRFAQDVVDYALDRQKVRDPSTGQISKVSSSYSHTWVDSTGKYSYQTNDVNADPNGVLAGSWTRQDVVHGDGSQK